MRQIEIPFLPRPAQQYIFNTMFAYMFFVAVCHRRMGKTLLAANWLIKEALEGQEDFRGYYFAPNQKQAKNLVWGYFKRYLEPMSLKGLVKFNETELRIDFPDNKKIFLAGAENIEVYRGVYIDRAVLDEMASWPNAKYAFYEVLYPAMLDRKGRGFIIGTVKGLDLFHTFYTLGQTQNPQAYPGEILEWGSILLPVTTTGVFTDREIERMKRTMPQDAFDREMMCDFFADSPGILITPKNVKEAVDRPINHHNLSAFPEIWGYDVGFSGDPSVLAKRKGPLLRPLQEFRNKDSVEQGGILHRLIQQASPKPEQIYVDAGQGEGVISQLNAHGHEDIVVPVFFNSSSPSPSCVNMRAYMYDMTRKWLAYGQVPGDKELQRQLANQLLDDDADRRVKLKPKKFIKEALGCSPDRSDATALTFAGGDEEELDLLAEAKKLYTTYGRCSSRGDGLYKQRALRLLEEAFDKRQEDKYDPMNFMNREEGWESIHGG